jgi:hypothetical protein
MNGYYLKGLHLYRGCDYGVVCMDFDIENKVYLRLVPSEGLELPSTVRSSTYVTDRIIGVDIV